MAHQYERDVRALEAQFPLAWLFEVEIPTDPLTRIRLTTNNDEVKFGEALDGTPRTYRPFPMRIGVIERTREGNLPQIQVAGSNARGVIVPYLEDYRGLVGQPAIVQLVSLGDIDNVSASLRFDGEVVSASMTPNAASLNIGSYNALGTTFPKNRHVSEHCRFAATFGGPGCGYQINHPLASFTTCPGTHVACTERGDDEENVMGVARQHPERFGAFRALPNG